jgi:hypothetical protein
MTILINNFQSDSESKLSNLLKLGIQVIEPGSTEISILNKELKIKMNYLIDFSIYHIRKDPFLLYSPSSVPELLKFLKLLRSLGLSYVVRGSGHSLNASSIPGAQDVLISMHKFQEIDSSNLADGFIDVGAGCTMNEINSILGAKGYALPVSPDGVDLGSPTVGGFLVAGGICSSSHIFGGFWNYVSSITAITNSFDIVSIDSSDKNFLNYFGGKYLNHIIINVRLKILPQHQVINFDSKSLNIHNLHNLSYHNFPIWFNFHCDVIHSDCLVKLISITCQEIQSLWHLYNIYIYQVNNNKFVPPNILPTNASSFVRVGAWGCPFNRSQYILETISSKFAYISNANPNIFPAPLINYRHSKLPALTASSNMLSIIDRIRNKTKKNSTPANS